MQVPWNNIHIKILHVCFPHSFLSHGKVVSDFWKPLWDMYWHGYFIISYVLSYAHIHMSNIAIQYMYIYIFPYYWKVMLFLLKPKRSKNKMPLMYVMYVHNQIVFPHFPLFWKPACLEYLLFNLSARIKKDDTSKTYYPLPLPCHIVTATMATGVWAKAAFNRSSVTFLLRGGEIKAKCRWKEAAS